MPSGRIKEDPEVRFWRYVAHAQAGPKQCWLWMGGLYKGDGYGQFWDGERRVRAHRFAYETFVEPAGDLFVLHKCDERRCVNPTHLFLGTHQDNMADMVKKGRSPDTAGERNGAAKLTVAQVKTARYAHFKYGIPQSHIAKRYGVSPSTISLAIRGLNWAHL